MWLYYLLDVTATIVEAVIFYVISLCFCQTCHFQKAVSRVVPPVIYAIVVIILTFFTDIGAYRMFILLSLMVGLILLFYKEPFQRALIVMELTFLVQIPLSESVGLSIMSFVYHGDVMMQIDGTSIIKWQVAGIYFFNNDKAAVFDSNLSAAKEFQMRNSAKRYCHIIRQFPFGVLHIVRQYIQFSGLRIL